MVGSGCSDLLDSQADVVVRVEVADQAAVMKVRQQALASAPAWGGVRVGERSADIGDSALEFTLPGENLDIALGAIDDLDARRVSTDIDVDAAQISRTTTPPEDRDDPRRARDDQDVRLRLEVAQSSPAGVEGLLRTLMAVFSVIGVIATVRWFRDRLAARRDRRDGPPRRTIDRVDLRDEPPTDETPRVPPVW